MLQSLVHGAIFLALDTIAILDYALLAIHAVREATSRWLNVEVLSGAVLGMIVKGYLDIPSN